MSYSTYENWAETGTDWPQAIPQHWELKKFRFLFKFGRGLGITKSDLLDEGIPCVNYGEIHSKFGFEVIPGKHSLKCVDEMNLDTGTASLLKNGDFVFADTSEDIEGSGNFTYLNSETPTFAGYHTVIARPTTDNSSRFIAYLFDSEMFRYQIRKNVSGVKVYSITQDILKDCRVWLPPIGEQENIVGFLDRKTGQIDQLIEKKKALIEKLDEQRIAVITQAVTKGINGKAKMKPSGVEWLGDIPEHWETRRLKLLSDSNLQYGANEAAELDDPELPRFIRITDVNSDGTLRNETFRSIPEEIAEPFLLDEGDILLARSGATVGKSFIYKESWGKAAYAGYLIRFRTNSEILNPEFAYLFFQTSTYWANINSTLIQSTIQNFSAEKYAEIQLPLPPLEEQERIVEHLKFNLNKLSSMKNKVSLAISTLEEYRQALITSAITGKVDVQNIQIPQGE